MAGEIKSMEIEQLTKSQLLLLALLVSFVTSIATGIVTVTLVNQAPTDVIRTINREVQTVVEKVTPGETKIIERINNTNTGPTESDLIVLATKKNKDSMLLIKLEDGTYHPAFSISPDGIIMSQAEGITKDSEYDLVWSVNTSTSTVLKAKVETVDEKSGVALLKLVPAGSSSGLPFVAPKRRAPAFGERGFALGITKDFGQTVRLGNVMTIHTDDASSTPIVVTSVASASSINSMPVFDLSGDLIGLYIGAFLGFDGVAVPGDYFSSKFAALLGGASVSKNDNTAAVANSIP